MDNTTLVAQVGIGLAHQILESKVSDIQSHDYSFRELKDIYRSAAYRDQEFLHGMKDLLEEKAAKFRGLLFVLWESRMGDERDTKRAHRVYSRTETMTLTFGQLKALYQKTCYDDLRNAVAERIFQQATTIEQLQEAGRCFLIRYSGPRKSRHDPHRECTEADSEEFFKFQNKVALAVVEKMEAEVKTAPLQRLVEIANYLAADHRRFSETILPKVMARAKELPLSFGQLYKAEGELNCFSPLRGFVEQLMANAPLLYEDIPTIAKSNHSYGKSTELLIEKITDSSFTLPQLCKVYELLHERNPGLTQAIATKIKAALPTANA